MDKTKIGHFIAKCRKDKGITQEQLAQLVDVSNKSVSKWENGNCLPDKMLLKPLCDILDITIAVAVGKIALVAIGVILLKWIMKKVKNR